MIGTFDLEKRVAELERRLDEGEDMNHADRIEKLERAHDDLWDKVVTPYRQRLDALEARQPAPRPVCAVCHGTGDWQGSPCPDCQPAPEPEQGWEYGHGNLYYNDAIVNLTEFADLLNAHGFTPTSKPIDKERGRELVRQCEYANHPADFPLFDMRDWIASVCGED